MASITHARDMQFHRDSDLTRIMHQYRVQTNSWRATLSLAYVSLGVMFGDIGTSPLYVFSATFSKQPSTEDILGVLSIIFWSITVFVLLKYVLVVLHATDHGEGGTFALYSVLCRTVGIIPHHSWDTLADPTGVGEASGGPTLLHEHGLNLLQQVKPCWHSHLGVGLCRWLRRTWSAQIVLMVVAVMSTAMLIGDGVLTPAISILSAVDGLLQKSVNTPATVGIACVMVFILFVLQHLGTHRLSYGFSPIVILWLAANLAVNIYNLAHYGGYVWRSVSPYYIYKFFANNGQVGWEMLGGTLLCMTGAEAMFAELGHVSHAAVALSFCFIVYPCLIITYMGQAAYLVSHPEHYYDTFWLSLPRGCFWPMFVIALAAAFVASQAIISGCFSIIRQAINLGLFPPLRITHTSTVKEGQIYIMVVNYSLMILTIAGVAGFQDTTALGTAYGLSVIFVMIITTCLVAVVMVVAWEVSLFLVVPWFLVYFSLEAVYLSANLYKVPAGGWYTLAIAGVVSTFMLIWWAGNHIKMKHLAERRLQFNEVIQLDVTPAGDRLMLANSASKLPLARPIGLGIYYNEGSLTGMPAVMVHVLRNLHAVQQVAVILTVRVLPMPHIKRADRMVVRTFGGGVRHFYMVVVRYGYLDRIDHGSGFVDAIANAVRAHLNDMQQNNDVGRVDKLPPSVQVAMMPDDGSDQQSMSFTGPKLFCYRHNASSGGAPVVDPEEHGDVQPLLKARHTGVIYYMGRHMIAEARKGNLWQAFIGPVYSAMERASFADIDAYKIPHDQLVDLGIRIRL